MKFVYRVFNGKDWHEKEMEYFSVKDAEEFCGMHHTKPSPLGGYADDGFGNRVKR